MFGLFNKKSPKEKLEAEYKKLLSEAHKMSAINRKKADELTAEAEKIIQKIESL